MEMLGKMRNLKAVFFDADGTLVDHEECERLALVHLFRYIGIDYRDEFQRVFRPLDAELWTSAARGECPVRREDIPTYRFKVLFERLGIKFGDFARANDLFKEGLAATASLTAGAEEAVAALHAMGLTLCVVTNGLISLQRPRVANSKIGKYISQIIVSEEVGAFKPNPLIFTTLLERLCLAPENVIMVGDSLQNDILGAKNAGIKSVWYNPGRVKNDTEITPDYEIHNLTQVLEIIEVSE